MGSGASMEKDVLKPLLLPKELVEGSASLVSNELLRNSFTNYLKGGAWLDRLAQLVPDSQTSFSGDSSTENDFELCLHEYRVDPEMLCALTGSNKSSSSRTFSFSRSSSSTPFNPHLIATEGFSELYSGETKSFNHEELLVILLSVIYPFYLSSQEHERFLTNDVEHSTHSPDDKSRSIILGNRQNTRTVQSNESKRAQELLLGCAARYDQAVLCNYLQAPSWSHQVCAIFHEHALALCITDATKTGMVILFANRAFCSAFGSTESELVGQDWSILNAPSNEPSQLQIMQKNIRSTETVKFAITLQSKSKKPLLDLMAQKAVGSYSVSAHVVVAKSASLDALHMVDDVLILLSYLVKAPPLPGKASWMPTPMAALARGASGVFSHRQTSSSSSPRSTKLPNRNKVQLPPLRVFGSTDKYKINDRRVACGGGTLGDTLGDRPSHSLQRFRPGAMQQSSKQKPSTPAKCRVSAATGDALGTEEALGTEKGVSTDADQSEQLTVDDSSLKTQDETIPRAVHGV
eukprot:gene17424-19855_t